MAQIKLFGNLRQYVVEPQFETSASNVRQLLLTLCAGNAALCEALFEGEKLRPFIKITVNGRDIQLGSGLDTAVTNEDTIAIFPPIAGG
ncbi:MAG TPA: MoaD/ThiS family protein [Chloroflexi bacterium]|nr:MoaD/ThiS family protein [Chloroflexota bacterium]